MFETETEVAELQALLDQSLSGSTTHLQSIVQPGRRTLTAEQLSRVLTGMCVLAVATVAARGEPRISALDGHFWHGRWIFGTDRSAAKANHLAARPTASVAHLRDEDLGVFAHGTVEVLYPAADARLGANRPDDPNGGGTPDWPAIHDHLARHYGASPLTFGPDVVYYRLQPHWMVAYSPDPTKLLAHATG